MTWHTFYSVNFMRRYVMYCMPRHVLYATSCIVCHVMYCYATSCKTILYPITQFTENTNDKSQRTHYRLFHGTFHSPHIHNNPYISPTSPHISHIIAYHHTYPLHHHTYPLHHHTYPIHHHLHHHTYPTSPRIKLHITTHTQ